MDPATALLGEIHQGLQQLQLENAELRARMATMSQGTTSAALPQQQLHRELLKPQRPDCFHGDRPEQVDIWLYSLEVYRKAAGLDPDSLFVAFAVSLLKGNALTWWRSLPEPKPATGEAFATAATAWFKPVMS